MKLFNARTNTYPAVFHAPGATRDSGLWAEMLDKLPAQAKKSKKTGSYALVTWSSYDEPTPLELCAAAYGCPITVLRPKEEWTNIQKVSLLLDFLKKCKAKYIIGLDSADVLLAAHPNEIITRFKRIQSERNCQLLCNSSVRAWPRRTRALKACDTFARTQPGPYRNLNAGAWVGERQFVEKFYKEVKAVDRSVFPSIYRDKEQPSVKRAAFPGNSPQVSVDYDAQIFMHMLSEGHLVIEEESTD